MLMSACYGQKSSTGESHGNLGAAGIIFAKGCPGCSCPVLLIRARRVTSNRGDSDICDPKPRRGRDPKFSIRLNKSFECHVVRSC